MKKNRYDLQKYLPSTILLLVVLSLSGFSSCKDSEELPATGDGTCLLLTQKNEDGSVDASYLYDAQKRLIRVEYGENTDSFYTVDYAGEMVRITRHANGETSTTDCSLAANGYVEEAQHSDGSRSSYFYSEEGYLVRLETRNAVDSLVSVTEFTVLDGNLIEKKKILYGSAEDVITCTWTYYPDLTDRNAVFHFLQEGETPFSHPPIYGKPSINLPKTKTLVSENNPAFNHQIEYQYELCRIGNMLGREILIDSSTYSVDRFQYDCD